MFQSRIIILDFFVADIFGFTDVTELLFLSIIGDTVGRVDITNEGGFGRTGRSGNCSKNNTFSMKIYTIF